MKKKKRYHLSDVIVGKIYFILIRLKVKFMEISLIKVETSGTGSNTYEGIFFKKNKK